MLEKTSPLFISVDVTGNFQPAIDKAAEALLAGGVVGYPTETFYGLAVDIRNEKAIYRLFSAKRRPATQPVLILIAAAGAVFVYLEEIKQLINKLLQK